MNNLTYESIELYNFINNNIFYNPSINLNLLTFITNNITITRTINIPNSITNTIDPVVQDNIPLIYKYHNGKTKFETLYHFLLYYATHQYELSKKNKYMIKHFNMPDNTLNRLLYTNPFVSFDVQIRAEISNIIHNKYITNDYKINIYKLSDNNININRIFRICEFMKELSNNNKSIDLTIFFSPNKKKLIKLDNCLHAIHVNSGSTHFGKYMNIWRKEECEKVLIHELIHYLDIDAGFSNSTGYDNYVNVLTKKYNIKGTVNPFECYTDGLAILIHTIYVSVKSGLNLNELLKIEINFVLFQAAKVLYYYGITNFNELGTKPICQSTSIFSYYILKSSLLYSINDFVNFIGTDINFNNKLPEFEIMMDNAMNNTSYQICINHYINLLINNTNNNIRTTLRMSCLQLN
jgi:hypothetical protein